MGAAAGPNVVDDGLVLSLDASSPKSYNVGVSTNWTDRVGGNNGTLVGGTYHSDGPFVGAGYVEFDGSGDYLTTANHASDFSFGSSDFTMEFWINSTKTGRIDPIGWNYNFSSAGWAGMILNLSGSGNMAWYENNNSRISGSGSWNDGSWHHIAVTRDGNSVRMFLDGTQVGSTYTTSHSYGAASSGLIIGALSAILSTGPMDGYISNFRVIKGTALYTSNFTVPTKSLTAVTNTVLLTCQGNSISDASSSAHTITANGDAAANLGFPASAFEFDGSNYDHILSAANPTLNWGTGDFTVELWANVSSSTSFGTLFATEVNAQQAQNNTFTIAMNSSRRLGVIAYSTYSISNSSATQIPQNTWTHIVVTRQGTTLTLYIDKSSAATGTSSINYVAGGYSIGALPRSLSNTNFTGKVSNVRVYKGKALTLAEIEQNYNANKGRYA